MKIALSLDGVLCDTAALREEWLRVEGDLKFLSDTAFWGTLRPYEDVTEAIAALSGHELYVFAERPKAVFLTTRTWIKNHFGLKLGKDRLVMQALNRYDCRIREIGLFIGSNPDVLENLKIETVCPIKGYLVDREGKTLIDVAKEINCEYLQAT